MPHKLSAIEIAEGALLADLAVVFQLLATYVPFGGAFFQLFIPTALAVLVLRRGAYVALISTCVALFIVGVVTGLNFLVPALLPCGAGIFLGLTMRRRLGHASTLLLGVIGGTVTLFCVTIFFTLLAGVPMALVLGQMRRAYATLVAIVDFGTAQIGLFGWWRQQLYPPADALARSILSSWSLALLTACCAIAWPLVIVTYFITNSFVRLLGYDVLPFPGGWLEKSATRFVRWLARRGYRRGLLGKGQSHIGPDINH